MKRRSREEVPASESGHGGSVDERGEKRPLAVNVSSPGIVSLAVPIVLPFAVLAILLAANLSLGEQRGHSRMPVTPVAQQSLYTERNIQ